jgi:hypothetical protein
LTRIELSNGIATISAPAAIAAASAGDISAAANDYTLRVKVWSMSAASGTPGAVIGVEDATDGTFTAVQTHLAAEIQGPVAANAPVVYSWRKRDIPMLRVGTASAKARINVTALKGTTPALKYEAWLETN